MKVFIGPYRNWIGPYQIADKIFFWLERSPNGELEKRWDYQLRDRFAKWLADTWVADLCRWIEERKHRKIEIHIDRYDTWSMDHTLSLIIVPMLKQLQESKHGSPFIDDEDVPDELKSTSAPPKEHVWDVDDNHEKRWDWVLDEMIWAFSQIINQDEDDEFYDPYEEGDEIPEYSWMTREEVLELGKFNREKQKAHNDRITRGTKLFGKYYQNLWD